MQSTSRRYSGRSSRFALFLLFTCLTNNHWRDEVTELVRQDDRLVSVSTADGTELPTDAVFVAAPFRAASDLPASLCEVNEAGFAVTDVDGRTSRPGVWVIGNANDPIGHLAHATAAGARVGPWVVNYLIELSRSRKTA